MKPSPWLFFLPFTLLACLMLNTALCQPGVPVSLLDDEVQSLACTDSTDNDQQCMRRLMGNAEEDLVFIENIGQIQGEQGEERPEVLFLTRFQGVDMYITRSGITYLFKKRLVKERTAADARDFTSRERSEAQALGIFRLDMELIGANADARIIRDEEVAQPLTYFTPNYPDGVSPGVYKKITLENIYDRIDMVYYEVAGKMKYDFIVKTGADASQIKMKYKGAHDLYVDDKGSLIATTSLGEIREEKPYSYFKTTGMEVACSYQVNDRVVQFDIENHENDECLIIDPIRIWCTYYGGNEKDYPYSMCTDSSGNLYLAGNTWGNFPTHSLPGAYNQSTHAGTSAFILKFNKYGERLWATYYGGGSYEEAWGICTDSADNVYVTGRTGSMNFPTQTLAGAYNQSVSQGASKIFILKFNSLGERLWATYYGGTGGEEGSGICTDQLDNLYVTGMSSSYTSFPVQHLPGAYNQSTGSAGYDVVIIKFNSSGERLWATFYGGNGSDESYQICSDHSNNIYITGTTYSNDFPIQTLAGAYNQTTYSTGMDVFILKFSSTGERLWATYYGGTDYDIARDLCVDSSDNIFITGSTFSTDFPVQSLPGAFNQTQLGDHSDAYILKFNASGERLWATYYGVLADDQGYCVSTDSSDSLYVSLATTSAYLPTQALMGSYNQTTIGGGFDLFLLKFSRSGKRCWGTYYGGILADYPRTSCIDSEDNLYIAGDSNSNNLPLLHLDGAYTQTHTGGQLDDDIFILRFAVPFLADRDTVSVSTGGTINLSVKAGEANAGRWYLILGSLSGASPGIPLPNGGATLPVNWDLFTDFVLRSLNGAVFPGFLMPLDGNGQGTAQINVRSGLDPSKIGQVMTYAYCLEGLPDWDFASTPVEVEFVP